MINLRNWQASCIDLALENYSKGQKHFLCLATPGAGKSTMAAVLAKKLLSNLQVDFVICFSPSKAIAHGLTDTFERVLGNKFDGRLGAKGQSLTYHSLNHLDRSFWQLFHDFRVLVVLDEIHHCAGDTFERANAWGQVILKNVQEHAAYTLALTGTPWRTDAIPICLASYSHDTDQIICDFVYGLNEAVNDHVCRVPTVILFENSKVVSSDQKNRIFCSIKEYIEAPGTSYSNLLKNEKAINHVFNQALKKLHTVQKTYKNAAGLIVAESVKHTKQICRILKIEFSISPKLVTYEEQHSQHIIDTFRTSSDEWIVSVGMVSEGTDIPRLRVCCHFSNVKTELYFRQILGRIMRNTDGKRTQAWLYTLAHPQLVEYAHRLQDEVPETRVTFTEDMDTTNEAHNGGEISAIDNNQSDLSPIETGDWQSDVDSYLELTSTEYPQATDDYFKRYANLVPSNSLGS
ncbi:DEAD/DEAH box helicase [Photobacterium kasasachensis]|uniref:DEAD/DEAH box helicase n=1 Tax=Photobacterium kasasachensis TaxID=2910240 RepID=UPI003D0DDAF5